jgi:alkylation response protein AidB-like acyl-CoA dehydrogenase
MDFTYSTTQKQWQEKAKQFAQEWIRPHVEQLENDLSPRQILFQKMARNNLFTFAIPSTESGDTIAYLLALKEIAKVDAGIAVTMAVTSMVAEAIWLHGSQAQKENYLSRIASGQCLPAAFALTERDAGSDVKAIQTLATSTDEGYILHGEKQLITNADLAGVILIIARMSTSDHGSHSSTSAFLVDHSTPGISIPKKERKLGLLTANLVTLKLEDCVIAKSQLLGTEGIGLKIALSSLDSGRLSVAAQSLGIAEAAYEAALTYATQRQQFGCPISQQQMIAFKLAEMRLKLEAGELLLLKAAWLKMQNLPFTTEASMAKLFCSEAANWIAYEALQIHGGYGYTKDYLVEKYFRDARVTTLYEGTSEIQRLVIARHL